MVVLRKFNTLALIIIFSLFVLDGIVWNRMVGTYIAARALARDYFLDVGQGDSELVVLPGNIKIMTDAGPDKKVIESLEKVLPQGDRYIDIGVISHPQLDHFNGYNAMLASGYRFGAFVYNGRDDGPGVLAWSELLLEIHNQNIPLITLGAGDSIHYGNAVISFLSPTIAFDESAELNDTGLVERITGDGLTTLLTADIGFNVENFLISQNGDLQADVLKIGHHGSKYSSSQKFLTAVNPKIVAIEVGAKNTYGHPSKDALSRVASSTNAKIVRTDKDGTFEISNIHGRFVVKRY